MTASKRALLASVMAEYGRVVNHFLEKFWTRKWTKDELTRENLVVPETWLTARLRKVAAREAIDMVAAARERDGASAKRPVHRGRRMCVSSTIASLKPSKVDGEFDTWLHVASVGRGIALDLPLRLHRHYHRYANDPRARRTESYVITLDYVQLAFEMDFEPPRREGPELGVDSGINALATLSDGTRLGSDIKAAVERVKRCQHGSKGQQRARRALKQRMAEVALELVSLHPRLVVAEDLLLLSHGRKTHRRVSKNMRRSLGAWTYRTWLDRLDMACEANRVRLERVPPAYSSQRCHACGHTERGNRAGEVFRCRGCGYTDHADVNAARNLLGRFWGHEPHPAGAYGPGFQRKA